MLSDRKQNGKSLPTGGPGTSGPDGVRAYETQADAITAIAPKIDCIPQILRQWVKQAEKDGGMCDGVTTEERDRIKEHKREVRDLLQASAYFAQAPLAA